MGVVFTLGLGFVFIIFLIFALLLLLGIIFLLIALGLYLAARKRKQKSKGALVFFILGDIFAGVPLGLILSYLILMAFGETYTTACIFP